LCAHWQFIHLPPMWGNPLTPSARKTRKKSFMASAGATPLSVDFSPMAGNVSSRIKNSLRVWAGTGVSQVFKTNTTSTSTSTFNQL